MAIQGRLRRIRPGWAMVIALLVAMRLLTPTGFMPAFEGARLAITPCEELAPLAMAGHHGHHKSDSKQRHSCPYAAASAQPFLGFASPPDFDPPALVAAPAPATIDARLDADRSAERPRSRAPPLA